MSKSHSPRLLRPETLTALGTIVVAAAFLFPTASLKPISALLPGAMLIGMALLSVLLLISDQRKAGSGEEAQSMTSAPKRVFGAFLLIVSYALSTDFIGFYVSTAVAIPLVAYVFGYRSLPGLALATVIVVGAIYLIFDFGMAQTFPSGRLWQS
ncbi:MAG: tripartite tricarboxylate transporter TctB family protein [Rhodospirillales bacterium]|nr:tripartite tricarboxylate transporter TctB family protein [Rhodospirillales bacterium]MBO6788852.1 tripartite tricarboxylate transporter TctB family protein [Rhodospirillales bacterium]